MTIYTKIDIGTVDDDGTGDTLRAAFAKVNDVLTLQDISITLDEVNSITNPGTAKGTLWLRDDSPNVLVFTDDIGGEIVLGTGGGSGGGTVPDFFEFTASASQTTFTGVDDNGNTLAYTSGQIVVYLNGTALDSSDYTATNGTSVVLNSGVAVNDIIFIVSYSAGTTIEDAPSNGLIFGRKDGAWFAFSGGRITVQDNGSDLTTDVTKLNFVGFIVTEPVTDEITITAEDGIFTEPGNANLIGGTGAGIALSTGSSNFAAGQNALSATTAGNQNICIGVNAGKSGFTNYSDNICIGFDVNAAITGNQSRNVYIGTAVARIGAGDDNVAIGYNALNDVSVTGADFNVVVGSQSGHAITSGSGCVAIGYKAMGAPAGAITLENIAIGANAMSSASITTAGENIAIGGGAGSLVALETGDNNTAVGWETGANITTGSSNVMIGHSAGPTTDGSSGLYIHSSESDTPLIGGDFSTGIVTFNGAIRFTERATRILTPTATFGELWIRSDGPNVLVFTDDVGTDTVLGSGGGSALEVEDDGVSLSTAVTKFNFIGFNVSEPVNDEIEISFGVSAASNEYCPGYTSYTRVDDNEFTVDLVNAENLFYIGRRVKFDKAGVFDFGVISAVDFDTTSANDTHITLTMEGADTVPTGVFDVCLVTSATAWSPIASDPFGGSVISDICVGDISGTTWLFAVGDVGKCGVSDDGGATWTMLTTNTTENLSSCVYDSINETFWGGGDAGVLISTTNATSITLDTTSIPALAGSVTDDIAGFAYTSVSDELCLLYHAGATSWSNVWSGDQGSSWTQAAALGNTGLSSLGIKALVTNTATGPSLFATRSANTSLRTVANPQDTSYSTSTATTPDVASALGFFASEGFDSQVIGTNSGAIYGIIRWTGDEVTAPVFSSKLNAFAFSQTHARLLVVGDDQQIGYWDQADRTLNNAWTSVPNGFSPIADINAIIWDNTNAVFVAVASNGQICRSSNGTN